RAPREVPETTSDHVVFCAWDSMAEDLAHRLEREGTPYFVIEADPEKAARMYSDGVKVVRGEVDDARTYERLHVERARAVIVNRDDLTDTNIVLTVRELAESTRLIALAEEEHSLDILEL